MSATVVGIRNLITAMVKGETPSVGLDVVTNGKLTRLASIYTVTPRVIISNNLKYMDEGQLSNIVKADLKIFTAYLTQALRILTELGGVDVSASIYNLTGRGTPLFAGESHEDDLTKLFTANRLEDMMLGYEDSRRTDNINLDKIVDNVISNYEIELNFVDGSGNPRTIVIPLVIRPLILFTDTKELVEALVDNGEDASFWSRLDDYRAGVISLKDLILATDLVKKYKEKRLKNDNDVSKLIRDINNVNTLKELITGRVNFDTNYNIFIFDIREKPYLDEAVSGDIYKWKYRSRLCDALKAFNITLVDTEKERAVFMLDDDLPPSVTTFKMLKNSKDTDIDDIFKNLLLNKPPF